MIDYATKLVVEGEERLMKKIVRKSHGLERTPSRVAVRRRKIHVFALLPEIRANLPHEYRNTFTYRNPERMNRCDLCNRKRTNSRHRF